MTGSQLLPSIQQQKLKFIVNILTLWTEEETSPAITSFGAELLKQT